MADPIISLSGGWPRELSGHLEADDVGSTRRLWKTQLPSLPVNGNLPLPVVHLQHYFDMNAPSLPEGALATVPIDQCCTIPHWCAVGTWAPIACSGYNAGAGYGRFSFF